MSRALLEEASVAAARAVPADEAQRWSGVAGLLAGGPARHHHGAGRAPPGPRRPLPRNGDRAALDELEWGSWLGCDARGYAFTAPIARAVLLQEMLTPGQVRRLRTTLET